MGNMCSATSAGTATRKSTKKAPKAKKIKSQNSADRTATIIVERAVPAPAGGVSNPLNKTAPGRVPMGAAAPRGSHSTLNDHRVSNSLNPPAINLNMSHSGDAPHEDEPQRRMSNASSKSNASKNSHKSSLLRQITSAAAAKSTKAAAAVKDHDTLSTNKVAIIRGWIDMIDKVELLDPQDVAAFNRQVAAKEAAAERLGHEQLLFRKESERRFSMSNIVNRAALEEEAPRVDNVSMAAAGDATSQTRSQQLMAMPITKPL